MKGVDPLFVSFEITRVKDRAENMDDSDIGREFVWRRSWGHKARSCLSMPKNTIQI